MEEGVLGGLLRGVSGGAMGVLGAPMPPAEMVEALVESGWTAGALPTWWWE